MNATILTPPRLPARQSVGRFPQGYFPLPEPWNEDSARTESSSSAPPERSLSRVSRNTVIFHYEALAADRVKLAADFTGWDKHPIDLRRREDGTWQVAVELPRGEYSYRFLVDDQWRDDPQCRDYEPNPFGGFNAVVRIL